MKNYSHELASLVEAFLTKEGLEFEFDEERGVISLGRLPIPCDIGSVVVIFSIDDDSIVCSVVSAINVIVDKRLAVAEYITRANYGYRSANLEMDFEDGEVACKYYLDCADQMPNDEKLNSALYTPLAMLSQYGDGLLEVIYGNADPKEACEKAENN